MVFRHAEVVSLRASRILTGLNKTERQIELASIAGYMHDIGNSISREGHARTGAMLSYNILNNMGMPVREVAEIISAIGNHHEDVGIPVSDIAAALIIADKSDVHQSRVRKEGDVEHDIHDRVNFAAKHSTVEVDTDRNRIELSIITDTHIASVMQYFETFLERMIMSRKAANFLGLTFELVINGIRLS
jgi:metal-dependent HD superfamily phosphatase/phosphodiesterase